MWIHKWTKGKKTEIKVYQWTRLAPVNPRVARKDQPRTGQHAFSHTFTPMVNNLLDFPQSSICLFLDTGELMIVTWSSKWWPLVIRFKFVKKKKTWAKFCWCLFLVPKKHPPIFWSKPCPETILKKCGGDSAECRVLPCLTSVVAAEHSREGWRGWEGCGGWWRFLSVHWLWELTQSQSGSMWFRLLDLLWISSRKFSSCSMRTRFLNLRKSKSKGSVKGEATLLLNDVDVVQ